MSIAHLVTNSAKTFSTGFRRSTTSSGTGAEYVRHAPTGDPRLDLAHAERGCR